MLQGEREIRGARFEFALLGDVPYDARHEREFAHVRKEIDAADLAFVVHNGDFWWDGAGWTEKAGGLPPCSDETFQDRLRLAQAPNIPSYLFRRQRVGRLPSCEAAHI